MAKEKHKNTSTEKSKKLNASKPETTSFLNEYFNTPAGFNQTINDELEKIISLIGKKYGKGKAVDLAKGRVYLKNQIAGCSSRKIKFMLRSVKTIPFIYRKVNDDKFIFRFSNSSYDKVFKKIIEIILNDFDYFSDYLSTVALLIPQRIHEPEYMYSEFFIHVPLNSLDRVYHNGRTNEIRSDALILLQKIKAVDKRYKI